MSCSLKPTPVALASFACGALYNLEVDLVGKLLLGEAAVVALALGIAGAGAVGRHADLRVLRLVLLAGVLMLAGYALSDLIAGTAPWQYLRGWGRVTMLTAAAIALIAIVAQSPRNLWWLCLGFAAGTLVELVLGGVPPGRWKIGYGEPVALTAVTLGALAPVPVGALAVVGLGVLSVLLDYRSLGAALVLVGGSLLWRRYGPARRAARTLRGGAFALVGVLCAGALAFALAASDEAFAERRKESNVTRFAVMAIAAQAIADSPVFGLGSWTADERYTRLIREREQQISHLLRKRIRLSDSLIPHSQFMQAWLEGGVLAAVFFGMYGMQLAAAAWWLVRRHSPGALSPLHLFLVYFGLWNLAASPFLGVTRFYIAAAFASIALLAAERRTDQPRSDRMSSRRPAPAAALSSSKRARAAAEAAASSPGRAYQRSSTPSAWSTNAASSSKAYPQSPVMIAGMQP